MENIELNDKIGRVIEKLGFTSSKFADYIDVRRPIISHIIANRNKPSLEIIQRIVAKFPEMGLEWTFDGNELDDDLLNKLANEISREQEMEEKRELAAGVSSHARQNSLIGSILNTSDKAIARIVVIYTDNTFSEIKPA